jgi:hypothetical protein
MIPDTESTPSTIRNALVEYFSGACRLQEHREGASSIFALETPLARFDDINTVIFIKPTDQGWLLHDGGKTMNYLDDHGIDLLSTSQKQRVFCSFAEDLSIKHSLIISKSARRLEMYLKGVDGRQVLTFIECMVALSFLVMSRQAGLMGFSAQSLMNFANLKVSLQKALPAVRIENGIRPSAKGINVFHRWGISVFAKENKMTGCLQYLDGDNWDKVSRNVLITGALYRMSKEWLRISPSNFITVYAGPPELLPNTRRLLDQFKNGHKPQIVDLKDTKNLIKAVLSMPKAGKHASDVPNGATLKLAQQAFSMPFISEQLSERSLLSKPYVAKDIAPEYSQEPSLEDIWDMFAEEYRRELQTQTEISDRADRFRLLLGANPVGEVVRAMIARGPLTRKDIERISDESDARELISEMLSKDLAVEEEGTFAPTPFAEKALNSVWAKTPEYFKS